MKLRQKLLHTTLALAIGSLAASAQAGIWGPWKGQFQTSNGSNPHDGVLAGVSALDLYGEGSAAFFCATAAGCAGGSIGFGTQLDPDATTLQIGDSVTTLYQGVANAFLTGVYSPGLRSIGDPGTYQLTVAAMIHETVVGSSGTTAILTVTGGRTSLFFDDSSLAGTFIDKTTDILAGVGYTDGMMIANAHITGGVSAFTLIPGGGTGFATIAGRFGSGPTYFAQQGVEDPFNIADVPGFMQNAPVGFVSSTTLQYGAAALNENHETLGFFDTANGWTRVLVNKDWVVRADANVSLVPEPTTLAMMGLGLAVVGLSLRRRAA